MRYCASCKIEVFGGSICHICASRLIEKEDTFEEEKQASSFILGKKKRLKSDISQSMVARLIRLALEMAIFCAAFVGFTFFFMVASNWLSDQMESSLHRFPVGKWNLSGEAYISNSVRYVWYVGCAIIAALTAKYRFKFYK